MRCINTRTGCLEFYPTTEKPGYAILSHRWEDEEVTYDDMQKGLAQYQSKKGFYKLRKVCEQAQEDGIDYAWIDTCCINKDSSHELGEAINSMFAWYAGAVVCYAFLSDVEMGHSTKNLENSVWFTRGWTLQELLAPFDVEFYDADWQWLGTKRQLADQVARASGIDVAVLTDKRSFLAAPIAQRMSWSARRATARVEDLAYCLLGIFRINMSMNYGEGSNAFLRLQIALIERYPDDQTIFAWTGIDGEQSGLLASSPACFASSGDYQPVPSSDHDRELRLRLTATMRDVSIAIHITPWGDGVYLGCLKCKPASDDGPIGIFLRKLSSGNEYARIRVKNEDLQTSDCHSHKGSREKTVTVPNFEEPSATAAPMRRLDRIAAIDEHHIPEEGSPSAISEQDYKLEKPGLTSTNSSYAVGFYLGFLRALESSRYKVKSTLR